MDEELACILCKMGDSKSVEEAVTIYESLVDAMQKDLRTSAQPSGQTKLWGLRCRKADAQLRLQHQLSKAEIEKSFETMKNALAHCETLFGKLEGLHDERTLHCAQFLMEAYERCGRDEDAQKIKVKYALRSNHNRIPEVFDSQYRLSRWCMAAIFTLVLVAFGFQ